MKKIFLSALFILFFNSSLSFSQTLSDKIDALTDSVMANTNLPGMIVSVVCGDFKYEKAKGYADLANTKPMTLDKLFRIGSVTKTFTITVLFQLIDEGKLGLDDPVSKFFPDFPNGQNITVRMLTNMTSGIFNYSEGKAFADSMAAYPLHKYTPQNLVNSALGHPPYFAPGAGFHYSNTNTIMIGMIIEQLTGNTLQNETINRIITPLGLKNTTIPSNNLMPGDYSHGYTEDGDPLVPPLPDLSEKYDPSWAGAAGDIISDIEDLKVYIRALVKGSMISPKAQSERLRFVDVSDKFSYGSGIFKMEGIYLGHNGGYPGYTNVTLYSPEKDCSVIVFYNTQSNVVPEILATNIIELMNGK